MTRLNSTLRSGCELDNRTIKEEKQAAQAYRLRKHSRACFKQQVFFSLEKAFIRTGRLFGTRLNEQSRRSKTTSERRLRAMDVARQNSMEEGLQVKLLSWKEKPDNLIAGNVADEASCEKERVLSIGPDDSCSNCDNKLNQGRRFSFKQSTERLDTVNGEEQIEIGVKTDNRTIPMAKSSEKTLEQSNIHELLEELTGNASKISNGNFNGKLHSRDMKNGDYNGRIKNRKSLSIASTDSPPDNSGAIDCIQCKKSVDRTSRNRSRTLTLPSTNESLSLIKEFQDEFVDQKRKFRITELFSKDEIDVAELNSLIDNADISKKAFSIGEPSPKTSNHINSEPRTENLLNLEKTDSGKERRCFCGEQDDLSTVKAESQTERRPKRTNRRLKPRHDEDYIVELKQQKRRNREKNYSSSTESKKIVKPKNLKRKRKQKGVDKCIQEMDEKTEVVSSNKISEDGAESSKYINVDCVLGVRRNDSNNSQVLVQFLDSTSNWIETSEMDSPIPALSDYFLFPGQDLSAIHRLPSAWFGKPVPSWTKRKLKSSDFDGFDIYGDIYEKSPKDISRTSHYESELVNSTATSPNLDSNDALHKLNDTFNPETYPNSVISQTEIDVEMPIQREYEDLKHEVLPINPLGYDIVENSDEALQLGCQDLVPRLLLSEHCNKEENCMVEKKSKVMKRLFLPEPVSGPTPDYISRNGELEVLVESDSVEIILKHKDKRSKRIRSETCDNLIQQLEMRITDESCQSVVISGLEDYFASSMDMEKLKKFPSESEKTRYDEKMANLRYLFQTLKNYPKPIVAVISSPATGLAAALLSLVDMVYDQSTNDITKNGICNNKPHIPVLVPKLMGLQHKNEALLMGELPDSRLENQIKQVNSVFRSSKFSDDIFSTLKEMRFNEKLSYERPAPKKRGRLSSNKPSPIAPLEVIHNPYLKTRLSRLRFPGAAEQEEEISEVHNELKEEIEMERDLASQCLQELTEFWKEIDNCTR